MSPPERKVAGKVLLEALKKLPTAGVVPRLPVWSGSACEGGVCANRWPAATSKATQRLP
jgi:hypothetical protein